MRTPLLEGAPRQGYYFARPMDEAGLHRLLDQAPVVGGGWDARRFLSMLDADRA